MDPFRPPYRIDENAGRRADASGNSGDAYFSFAYILPYLDSIP